MTLHGVDAARHRPHNHTTTHVTPHPTPRPTTTTTAHTTTTPHAHTNTTHTHHHNATHTHKAKNPQQSTNRAGIPMPPAGGPGRIRSLLDPRRAPAGTAYGGRSEVSDAA
jgi:hypothetical protein